MKKPIGIATVPFSLLDELGVCLTLQNGLFDKPVIAMVQYGLFDGQVVCLTLENGFFDKLLLLRFRAAHLMNWSFALR